MKEINNFRKPKTTEEYIAIWGYMDDIVHFTKGGEAVKYWERNCPPRNEDGTPFITKLVPHKRKDGVIEERAAFLSYGDIVENRHLYENEFAADKKNFRRIYNLFAQVMKLDK